MMLWWFSEKKSLNELNKHCTNYIHDSCNIFLNFLLSRFPWGDLCEIKHTRVEVVFVPSFETIFLLCSCVAKIYFTCYHCRLAAVCLILWNIARSFWSVISKAFHRMVCLLSFLIWRSRELHSSIKLRKRPPLRRGKVSGRLPVPDHICRPPYVDSGLLPELSREHQLHDDEGISRMRAACELAACVLDYAGTLVRVSTYPLYLIMIWSETHEYLA